jgi:gliding motility-associated-like protein
VTYNIIINDACGTRDTFNFTPYFVSLIVADSLISCRDFTVFTNPHDTFQPSVHYYLYDQGVLLDSSIAYQPYFFHLPPGNYQVLATQALCRSATLNVSLPGLRGACLVPMFDSACTRSYAIYQSVPTNRETYNLVNTMTGASYEQVIPTPFSNAAIFSGVPIGSYNLISDSGCSVPMTLPPFTHTVRATFYRECTGQYLINVTISPPIISCSSGQGGLIILRKDTSYIGNANIGNGTFAQFIVPDSGDYQIGLYFSNVADFTVDTHYDTICPIDTVILHVGGAVIPNIAAQQQILVCGHVTTNIPYSIFGGTAPYTVRILGYPSRYVLGTRDTFPNVGVGIYTMIVSDSCGISRSFSVSVIDTCSTNCTLVSQFSLHDSLACINGMISLQNQSTGATHYQWYINGSLFAYGTDTSFTALPGSSYTIRLYAFENSCRDSFTVSFTDTCTLHCTVAAGFNPTETLTCVHTVVSTGNVSTNGASYQWYLNGHVYSNAFDTSITRATAGTDTITLVVINGLCRDSSTRTIVFEDSLPPPFRIDTTLCSPFRFTVNSHLPAGVWSDGTRDSVLTITAPGLYTTAGANSCWSVYDTVHVNAYPALTGFSLSSSKTEVCTGWPDSVTIYASVDSGERTVFIWNTGQHSATATSAQVTVYTPGTYVVTADSGGCPLVRSITIADLDCDSLCLSGFAIPDIFSPNGDGRNDTFFLPHVCDMVPFEMHIYNRWGELVFQSSDINQGWDGRYKGVEQREGVYWLWLMLTADHQTIFKSGTVTLAR